MKNIEINENSPEAILHLACLMAAIDNEIHPNEVEMIKAISIELGTNEELATSLLNEVSKQTNFEDLCLEAVNKITDTSLQKKALNIVTKVSTADDFVKEKEYLFMQMAIDKWEIF